MKKYYANLYVWIDDNRVILNENKNYETITIDEVIKYINSTLLEKYEKKEVNILYNKWLESIDGKTDLKKENHYFKLKIKKDIITKKNNYERSTKKNDNI